MTSRAGWTCGVGLVRCAHRPYAGGRVAMHVAFVAIRVTDIVRRLSVVVVVAVVVVVVIVAVVSNR